MVLSVAPLARPNAATQPEILVTPCGPFDALRIVWPGAAISLVNFGDAMLTMVAGSLLPGAASLWRCSHDPTADLYIEALVDGDRRLEYHVTYSELSKQAPVATFEPRAPKDQQPRPLLRIDLAVASTTAESAWGVRFSPHLVAYEGPVENGASVPEEALSMNLVIHRARDVVHRPVHAIQRGVGNIVGEFDNWMAILEDSWERLGTQGSFDLMASAFQESPLCDTLGQDGLILIYTALEAVRAEGAKSFYSIRTDFGDAHMARTEKAWLQAVPTLVLLRLTPAEMRACGLCDDRSPLPLETQQLSEGDRVRFTDLPHSMQTTVRISDEEWCPAEVAEAEVGRTGLVWSKTTIERAERAFAIVRAGFQEEWSSRAFELFEALEHEYTLEGLDQDIATLEPIKPVPDWWAKVLLPTTDGLLRAQPSPIDHAATLRNPDFWALKYLPDWVRRKTLAFALTMPGRQNTATRATDLCNAHLPQLNEVREALRHDPRADDVIRQKVLECGLSMRDQDNEAQLAALAIILSSYDDSETSAFLGALKLNDIAAATSEVQRILLPGPARMVAT